MGVMDIANQLSALMSQGQKQAYDEFGPERAQQLQQAGIDAAGATVGSTKGIIGGLVPDATHLAAYEQALMKKAAGGTPDVRQLVGTKIDFNQKPGVIRNFKARDIGPDTAVEVDVKGTNGFLVPFRDLLNKAKPME